MKKYLALILLVMSTLIVVSCGSSDHKEDQEPQTPVETPSSESNVDSEEREVGIYPDMKAPEMALKDRDGNEIKLSEYKGKVVFLNFWATTCPYCVDEMPDLESFYQTHKDESDVALIGVNMTKTWEKGSKDTILDWLDERDITFPVVYDEDGVEAERWMAQSLPVTFIIDPDGISLGAIMGKTDIDTLEKVLKEVRGS